MREARTDRQKMVRLQQAVDCLRAENKCLKKRLNTMQELIDFNEGVVENAVANLRCDDVEEALRYLEEVFVVWDEKQYENMEGVL